MVDGEQEFVVQYLLCRRRVRRGQGFSTEYLVRWAGYRPEDNAWHNMKDLGNARELVEDFERQTCDKEEAMLP